MIKCDKCGREFNRISNKEMHEKFCKGVKNTDNKDKDKKDIKDNKDNHIHEFILLNPRYPSQRKAIENGFNLVCKSCKELE